MKSNDKSRILYLDILRIIAAIGVVTIHVSGICWEDYDVNSAGWLACHILNGLARISVPIFVMISGAFFLDPSKELNIKKLYSKNILHLAIAFFFWSFLYTAYHMVFDTPKMTKTEMFNFFVTGEYHLWYVYMIIGLYVLTPVLRCMSDEVRRYFLKVSFVVAFLIPTFVIFHGAFGRYEPVSMSKSIDLLIDLYNAFIRRFHLDYIPYYVLGYELKRYPAEKINLRKVGIVAILSTLVTLGFPVIYAVFTGKKFVEIYDSFSVFILVSAACLILILKKIYGDRQISSDSLVARVSDSTFGIYLSHLLWIFLADSLLHVFAINVPVLILMILIIVVAFVTGMLVTLLLKKIGLKILV